MGQFQSSNNNNGGFYGYGDGNRKKMNNPNRQRKVHSNQNINGQANFYLTIFFLKIIEP